MKKKKLIFIISMIVCVIVAVLLYYFGFNKSFASKLTTTTNFNSYITNKNAYVVDTNCRNADSRWDYANDEILLSNITGVVSCDINFRTSSSYTTLANKIISLYNGGDTNISITNITDNTTGTTYSSGYRYIGTAPNNYVWFNNERWRIIGVLDANFHGQTGKNLVKIIKSRPLGQMALISEENSSVISFNQTKLYTILNSYYYYNSGSQYGRDACSQITFLDNQTSRYKCNYEKYGINNWYSYNMVQNVAWSDQAVNVSVNSINYQTLALNSIISGSEYFNGYIGLANSFDASYIFYKCGNYAYKSWLKYDFYNAANTSYLMDRDATEGKFRYLEGSYDGTSYYSHPTSQRLIIPTLYLKETVFARSGTGTYDDPYVLEMNK